MKIRIVTLLIVTLFGISVVQSKPIDVETAIQRYESYTGSYGLQHTLLEIYTDIENQPTAYVVTYNVDTGFIILSADDSMKPILGYSANGSFSTVLPAPLEELIKCYKDVVRESRNKPLYIAKRSTNEEYPAIGPLITSAWAQSAPYNDLIPNNYPTGCVATAMAQVMNYWKYPKRAYNSVSYVYKGYTYEMDLGEEDFDWANMLGTYSSNYSKEEAHAVAYLMKACGYSVEMMYGPNGSGSYPSLIPNAFKNYFGYDSDVTSYARYKYTREEWIKLLYENLRDYGPMVFSGYDTGYYGHTFVCDGYDGNGFFHFNWGWGFNDGFFDIEDVNGYKVKDEVTANIRPKAAEVMISGFSLNGIQYESTTDIITLEDVSFLDLKFDLNITTGLIDTYIFLTVDEEIPSEPEESFEIFKTIIPLHIEEGDQEISIEKQIILPDTHINKQYKVSLSYYGVRNIDRVKTIEFKVKQ